jgi:hypothetical protein
MIRFFITLLEKLEDFLSKMSWKVKHWGKRVEFRNYLRNEIKNRGGRL